jgi:hypothetical protein
MCAERLPDEQKEFFHRPRLGRSTWRPDPAGPVTLASNRAQRAAPDFFVLPRGVVYPPEILGCHLPRRRASVVVKTSVG